MLTVPSVVEANRSLSARLNRKCFCITLDRTALWAALNHEAGDAAFCETSRRSRYVPARARAPA